MLSSTGTHHRCPGQRLRRRRVFLSYLVITCSLLLKYPVEASQSEYRISPGYYQSLRGGSSEDEEEEKTKSRLWTLGALFRLNNDIISEASVSDDNENETELSSTTGGRGGALVKEAKPRRFQWLAPLDTSRVAPLSSRLLQDEEVDQAPVGKSTLSKLANKTATSRMWWVKTWAQAFPDQEDEVDIEIDEVDIEMEAAPSDVLVQNETKAMEPSDAKQESTTSKKSKHRKKHKKKKHAEATQQLVLREVTDTVIVESNATINEMPPASNEAADVPSAITNISQGHSILALPPPLQAADEKPEPTQDASPYVSSGYWSTIDRILTAGYAQDHPAWRVSRRLRTVRKATARITGLHGALSGKGHNITASTSIVSEDAEMGMIRRRLAAINRARANIERLSPSTKRKGFWGRGEEVDTSSEYSFVFKKSPEEVMREQQRKERVKEIDKQIVEAQQRLQELACEKDVLQRRPSPMWNYTTDSVALDRVLRTQDGSDDTGNADVGVVASRRFNFPPDDLVDDYLDVLFVSDRLVKLNHTDLWRKGAMDDEEDDDDDELLDEFNDNGRRRRQTKKGSGNWLLRNGLGEKIGETAETAAYKAVCNGVMSVLARGLSAIHGVNIMSHTDIRLFMEQAPDLPPLAAGIIPGSGTSANNYAQEAIQTAMRRGARKHKKRRHRSRSTEDAFLQRDAVVETLLSHCQISAPLLTLFPLAWQRAMLGNIITLICAIVSDFFDGLQFQILGHQLSFSFTPITEEDMIRHIGMVGDGFNRRRARPDQFEAAVQATAQDLSENLKFLDKWHERALGSGMLRAQIANLIARLVLTLVDDVLSGARMDLWTAHAGGPRLVAGLEYRTNPQYME